MTISSCSLLIVPRNSQQPQLGYTNLSSNVALVKAAAALTTVTAAVTFAIRRIRAFVHDALRTAAVTVTIAFAAFCIGTNTVDARHTRITVAAAAAFAIGIGVHRNARNKQYQSD